MSVSWSRDDDFQESLRTDLAELVGFRTLVHELIQNADDAPAQTMSFEITDKALYVKNDGEFSKCETLSDDHCSWRTTEDPIGPMCDFHSIRNRRGGPSRRQVGTTGAFGIGFTAVYQVTDRPILVSNGWCLQVKDWEADRSKGIRAKPITTKRGTIWKLRWARTDSGFRNSLAKGPIADDDISKLSSDLPQFVPASMVFLRNLKSISVTIQGQTVLFERQEADLNDTVTVTKNGIPHYQWSTFSGEFKEDADRLRSNFPNSMGRPRSDTFQIALPLTNTSPDNHFYATLPTDRQTYMPLLINASFYPGTSRKDIKLDSEEDPLSSYNRIAISSAAELLAANLDSLPGLVGDERVIHLLTAARSLYNLAESGQEDPVFAEFWKRLRPRIPNARIVPDSFGEHYRPTDVVVAMDDRERYAASILREIGIRLISDYFASKWQELDVAAGDLGIRTLNLIDIVEGLSRLHIDEGLKIESLPQPLHEIGELRKLWSAIDSIVDRKDELGRDEILECPLVLTNKRELVTFTSALKATREMRTVLEGLGLIGPYLADEEDFNYPNLRRLIKPFDDKKMIEHLEESFEQDIVIPGDGFVEILKWFSRVGLNSSDSWTARLSNLPIFPMSGGYSPLGRLSLASDFPDQLGVAEILDVHRIDKETLFFIQNTLGAQKLELSRYLTEIIPHALAEGSFDDHQKRGLLALLADRLSTFEEEETIRSTLRQLEIIPCLDNVWRSAESTYFESNELKVILGDALNFAKLPRERVTTNRRLFEWLGVATEPRSNEILDRCRQLSNDNELRRTVAPAMIQHLGRRFSQGRTQFEASLQDLKTINWLPARTWKERLSSPRRPTDLYTKFQEQAFETTGIFLDVDDSIQSKARDLLNWLGVPTTPKTSLVVEHLKICARENMDVRDAVYNFLQLHVDEPEIGDLRNRPCLRLENGLWIKPSFAFLSSNPFGRRRYLLNPDFRKWDALLPRIGVRESPSLDDAIDVLNEVALDYANDANVSVDEVAIVRSCWTLLTQGLDNENNNSLKAQIRSLSSIKVVPVGSHLLRTPKEVFFNDSEDLALEFSDDLNDKLIPFGADQWQAQRVAGVRHLSHIVKTRLIDTEPLTGQNIVRDRLWDRRSMIAAVLYDTPQIVQHIEDFFREVEVALVSYLLIQHVLTIDGRQVKGQRIRSGALYQPEDADSPQSVLYAVVNESDGVAWDDIASEFISALDLPNAPAGSNIVLGTALATGTAAEAAKKLRSAKYVVSSEVDQTDPSGGRAFAPGATVGSHEDSNRILDEQLPYETIGGLPVEDAIDMGGEAPRLDPLAPRPSEMSPTTEFPHAYSPGGKFDVATPTPRTNSLASHHPPTEVPLSSEATPLKWEARALSYVTPAGPRAKMDRDRIAMRQRVDENGIQAVIRDELANGRNPMECWHQQPGYDVVSEEADGQKRYIEVKSLSGVWSRRGIALSKTQFQTALKLRDEYWLYVVERSLTDNPIIRRINDPAGLVNQYYFDDGWWQFEKLSRPLVRDPFEDKIKSHEGTGRIPLLELDELTGVGIGGVHSWFQYRSTSTEDGLIAIRVGDYDLGIEHFGDIAIVRLPPQTPTPPKDGTLVLVETGRSATSPQFFQRAFRYWWPTEISSDERVQLMSEFVDDTWEIDANSVIVLGTVEELISPDESRVSD